MKEKDNDKKNNSKVTSSVHMSFTSRLFLRILLFFLSIVLGMFLLFKSFNFIKQQEISYNEVSNLDYNVYLKENEFYEEEYLGKNKTYIASLIDHIKFDFNYSFTSDMKTNLNFDYLILGKLVIADVEGKNNYLEKDYILLDNKSTEMINSNNKFIEESIDIDYGYYNSLVNKFKMAYGLETSSSLTLYMVINKRNIGEEIIDSTSLMSVIIPLSEKAINIKLDYNEISRSSKLISKSNVIIDNIVYFVLAILLIILSLYVIVKILESLRRFRSNKSEYDKFVSKIIREYDRLIVETTTAPIIADNQIIKINKFNELIDVRDNLKLPIMYYNVNDHHICYFYILCEDKIYLYVVKDADFTGDTK